MDASLVALEALCRRHATRVSQGGVVYLTHDADPLLTAAFAALGWKDRHPEFAVPVVEEVAAVESPERAVVPKAKRKIW